MSVEPVLNGSQHHGTLSLSPSPPSLARSLALSLSFFLPPSETTRA